MAKLRVGIVGAGGGIANARAQHYAENPNSELVACASRTVEKARATAEKHGCRALQSWQDVVSDPEVDAVCIATPNMLHFEQAKAALENGKHTEVEYPLSQTLEQIDALKAAADAKGVVLHHGLNVRSEPLFLGGLEVLPKLGDLAHARITYFGGGKWYIKPELVGDMFLALHIHFIDYFRGWFGEVRSLLATKHTGGQAEGFMHSGTILMEHEKCPAAYIEFGMGYPGSPAYSLEVLGTDGLLVKGKSLSLMVGKEATEVAQPKSDALRADSDNFVAEVVEGAAPMRSWEDGRRTMELSLDCTRSAETGEKLTY